MLNNSFRLGERDTARWPAKKRGSYNLLALLPSSVQRGAEWGCDVAEVNFVGVWRCNCIATHSGVARGEVDKYVKGETALTLPLEMESLKPTKQFHATFEENGLALNQRESIRPTRSNWIYQLEVLLGGLQDLLDPSIYVSVFQWVPLQEIQVLSDVDFFFNMKKQLRYMYYILHDFIHALNNVKVVQTTLYFVTIQLSPSARKMYFPYAHRACSGWQS